MKDAIDEQTKTKGDKALEYVYDDNVLIKDFDIASKNTFTIKKQAGEQKDLETAMKTYAPDIDSFIVEQFSMKGMKNIYGDVPETFKDSDELGPQRYLRH